MNLTLKKASPRDAGLLHAMQLKSFAPLLEKYQDYETSPGNEPIEKTAGRISRPDSVFYIILWTETPVGGIRATKRAPGRYHLGPVFVLPEYQGRGVAQQALRLVEATCPDAEIWELDTVLQEKGNCHLYEKLGYRRTGTFEAVNDRLTLVDYEKRIEKTAP